MSEDNKLLVGVHSNSLNEALKNDKRVVEVLLECARMRECYMLATPTDASVLSMLNPEIVRVSYEDQGDGAFIAVYENGWTGFRDFIRSAMITDLYQCQEHSAEFKEIKGAFHDLLAFEAISSYHKDESIFVTQFLPLLEKNVWIQKRFDVKILSFVQALEYFDLYLKKRNFYYEDPYLRQVDGKAFHYWFLLKDLVPKFAEAWSIAVFGKNVVQHGPKIQEVLIGLAGRFQNAFCSSDRIAMEYVKRPVNSTEWEMLYNFNYFCLLATGIFDSLAWLTVFRYSLPIPTKPERPYEVSIHITKPKSRGDRFVSAIARYNSSLASFIRNNQDLIDLYYPMRDATQHREPAGGAQFEQANEGWTATVADIKQEAIHAIQRLDQPQRRFTKWGLLSTSGIPYYLEPYRFTRTALRNLMTFANNYIALLDFPSLIASNQNLIDKITAAKAKESETSFIAEVYWRRDSHLPILFRSK